MERSLRQLCVPILAAIFGFFLVIIWPNPLMAADDASVRTVQASGSVVDQDVLGDSGSTQASDQALDVDLQGVADQLGITFDEAKDQLEWQNDWNEAVGTLMVTHPDLITGAEAARERSPRHVRITLPGAEIPPEVSEAVDPLGLDVEWILGSEVSSTDLEKMHVDLHEQLHAAGVDFRIDRTPDGKLIVRIEAGDQAALSSILSSRYFDDSNVTLDVVERDLGAEQLLETSRHGGSILGNYGNSLVYVYF